MASSEKKENLVWDSEEFAKVYGSAEKLTGTFAQMLVEEAKLNQVSDAEELVILDEACGTGIVSVKLMETLSDKAKENLDLTCADFADPMVDYVGKRIQSAGWKNAKAIQSDGCDTKLPSSQYTHIFLNFGPMVFPDHKAGLSEISRMLRPGGIIAMSSWEKIGWSPDVRAAFATDPELPPMPSDEEVAALLSPGGKWNEPAWARDTVTQAGFEDVRVQSVPHTSLLDGVTELMTLVTGVVAMLMSRIWSKEQQEKYNERAKVAVEKYMEQKYRNSEIKWDWIAILITAKKPA
ncbi:uncharacterized protein Z518_06251 [Rhinocladiella mackenziei CBS 650.93]|uniref:Methyltransferase domain-containing protein n=1 Tax=Rhinocladiella mackenziei CBS 650.93 TaxID=1442369 RepID=A0A0D2IHY5_9EURO|nr:uncharacterized protein Z518_06251 [Rhinocladiella mackenziei CBS 650.93]KIX05379.1 hypothetical protein Z518_06251 [Rhinocladiella mackenziei CBS 650.93]